MLPNLPAMCSSSHKDSGCMLTLHRCHHRHILCCPIMKALFNKLHMLETGDFSSGRAQSSPHVGHTVLPASDEQRQACHQNVLITTDLRPVGYSASPLGHQLDSLSENPRHTCRMEHITRYELRENPSFVQGARNQTNRSA